jgi:glycosyltransferase involved in cell wall biosynthesis
MSLLLRTDKTPLISVIMSVYNGAGCVTSAINSILSQTLTDFEFIIVNDGSVDGTTEILNAISAQDPRVRVIHQSNTGITRALNAGLAQARGSYIARQDADDVSYPDRFARQIDFFLQDPALVLVGGVSDDIHENGTRDRWPFYDMKTIQKIVFKKTPFPHSTAIMRADVVRYLGGYDVRYQTAQDFELWMRFAKVGKIAMVQQPVLARYIHAQSISARRRGQQFLDALCARLVHTSNPLASLFYALKGFIGGYLSPTLMRCIKGRTDS